MIARFVSRLCRDSNNPLVRYVFPDPEAPVIAIMRAAKSLPIR